MKKLIAFFLFSISICAQQSNVSMETNSLKGVVSATKMNVVYRGIRNPISIAVPNCKSFTVTCPGLEKTGNIYYLTPQAGATSVIKLTIIQNDDSVITEEHTFRILPISNPISTIDGRNCYNCIVEMTKEELMNAQINIKFEDYLFEVSSMFLITEFKVYFSKNNIIQVTGNTFNEELNLKIQELKIGSEILINDMHYFLPGSNIYMLPRVLPIKIKIIEKEVNYFQSKEFIKDSLNAIKQEKKELRLSKKKKKL
ncbi:MAG: GldM family protein [Flavobacterium sp.]|uniref:GldM family protein n=1 Tax=Flavobacterium sp. TaxID=239 RepID=UPI0022C69354|nr:GldM family protein [Flavobacterium sp.]MCZ8196567.1 GldM family protein [Flavobacterium sp.]